MLPIHDETRPAFLVLDNKSIGIEVVGRFAGRRDVPLERQNKWTMRKPNLWRGISILSDCKPEKAGIQWKARLDLDWTITC